MKDSILNYEYIEEFITTNLGEDVRINYGDKVSTLILLEIGA